MKQSELLFVMVSFFIMVVIYFGLNLYHNYVTSTIPDDLNIQIIPIAPIFDQKAISDLKKRESISPVYQTNIAPPQTASQTASPSGGKP